MTRTRSLPTKQLRPGAKRLLEQHLGRLFGASLGAPPPTSHRVASGTISARQVRFLFSLDDELAFHPWRGRLVCRGQCPGPPLLCAITDS
jgi:hypothetical protein